MQFINPLLALGTLLFAVPLIIHLLNRQRFRRRNWAAMEFLLRAFKKQRRRLRMENLILLLLRCLIPLCLALAVARPYFPEGGVFFANAGTAHHILIFDASYSTGLDPQGTQSPHRLGRRMAGRLLEQLEQRGGQHKVTLVEAGVRVRVPVREDSKLERVRARLSQLGGPQDSSGSLLPALAQVADMLEEAKAAPTGTVPDAEALVYLFTDLQRRCFGEEFLAREEDENKKPGAADARGVSGGVGADSAREIIARIQEHAAFTVLDTGSATGGSEDNLQISDLKLPQPHAMVRVPQNVVATVNNLSRITRGVQVTLDIDGDQPTRRMVQVEAGGTVEVPFQIIFRETGPKRLRASIDGDGLAADNQRYLVAQVRERLRVLLVEGSSESEEALQDSFWIRAILDPTRGEGPPEITQFGTKVIDSIAFLTGRENLTDYDLIVLCNVERLTEAAAASLKTAVQGGTGLFLMLGNRVDQASYNLHLHGAGGQDALMPMRLARPDGYTPGGKNYFGSTITAPDHPAFADFRSEEYRIYLEVTPVYRLWVCDKDSLVKDASVLCQVRDSGESPLLVANSVGEGKVLTLTSHITNRPDRWNRIDYYRIAFRLFFPAVHWLSHPVTDPFNVQVGAALTTNLRERPTELAVVLPERAGGSKELVGDESRALTAQRFALPPFTKTEHAGIYMYEMNLEGADPGGVNPGVGGKGEEVRLPFAVNVDPKEGKLHYLSWAVVRDRLGVKTILRSLPKSPQGIVQATVSELGPFLLYLVLLLVLGEAVLARWISRRR
ncbi:MAG: BatA domain-containing protein [Planctomycetota bacterium]